MVRQQSPTVLDFVQPSIHTVCYLVAFVRNCVWIGLSRESCPNPELIPLQRLIISWSSKAFTLTRIHLFRDSCSQTRPDDEFWKTKKTKWALWTAGNFESERLPDAMAGSAESHFTTHYTVNTTKPSRYTANTESRVIKRDEIPRSAARDIPGAPRGRSSSASLETHRLVPALNVTQC